MSDNERKHGVNSRLSDARRAALVRTIRILVIFTISYNVVEAAVALIAGNIAESSALIGFGLDSVIEVSSAIAVAWQFSGKNHEEREKTALKIISLSFFLLAAYVSYDAISSLIKQEAPEPSIIGIAVASLSLFIMPFVSMLQRKAGNELGSHSAVADSKQTLLCTYMSGALLVGLLLNSLFGWWWADPLAALIIVTFAIREGTQAWKGDVCSSAELLYEQ